MKVVAFGWKQVLISIIVIYKELRWRFDQHMRFWYLSHWQIPQLIAYADAVELAVLILVWFFINSHTLCMQAAKVLASLHIYAGSLEPSFLDTAMSASTKIKYAVSFDLFFVLQV